MKKITFKVRMGQRSHADFYLGAADLNFAYLSSDVFEVSVADRELDKALSVIEPICEASQTGYIIEEIR